MNDNNARIKLKTNAYLLQIREYARLNKVEKIRSLTIKISDFLKKELPTSGGVV